MKFLKSIVAKIVAKIKAEPAVTTGGVAGVAVAVEQWIQTNHVTNVHEAVVLLAPIALSFVIRTFVTPTSKVATTK